MKVILFTLLFIFGLQLKAQVSDFAHINFSKADSIAESYKNEGLFNLPELSYKLTANLNTDAERFRAIYKWVCITIANDYHLYYKNKRKRQRYKEDSLKLKTWNDTFKRRLFKKLLKDKKTICTGYAYLVRELSKLANLECKIVHGYGRTSTISITESDLPNHSWNAIKLNNKWYLCDPTWASGLPDLETGNFTFKYNDGYFLANPELFAINHFPLDKKWILLNTYTPSFKEFIEAPILYGKAYTNLAIHIAPKAMHQTITKGSSITLEYQLLKSMQQKDVMLLIDSGNNSRKLQPTSVTITDNILTIKHEFRTSGFYDVHLYLKDQLIATYTVKVTR